MVWLSSANGIFRYDSIQKRFIKYNFSKDSLDYDVNQHTYKNKVCLDKNLQVYLKRDKADILDLVYKFDNPKNDIYIMDAVIHESGTILVITTNGLYCLTKLFRNAKKQS